MFRANAIKATALDMTILPAVRSLAVPAVAVAMVLLIAAAAGAQCEIPLFVKQGSTGANVMILADNSGSMNAAEVDARYNPNVTYSGNFRSTSEYSIRTTGNYSPRDFNSRYPTSPTARLVASDYGQSGTYTGNYLNFIFFTLTDAERATIPQVTRIQVLKSVLNDLIDRAPQLDFGLTVFNSSSGGRVIADCGATTASLHTQINSLTADAWTPLGESMETIVDYFSNARTGAPIQSACQTNFVLVVTDGLPTMDLDVSRYLQDADRDGNDPGSCASIGAPYSSSYDCSDHFDDVAYYLAHNDLRPDIDGDQVAYTYVVGFNENARLLQEAADNGLGLFYHATNASELFQSIDYALQDVLRRISSGSAVAVVSTERGTDDRLYRGKFMPLDWHGYLECYSLPYAEGDSPIWEAGSILSRRSPSDRRIFTALGDREYDFTASQAPSLRAAMMVATDAETENLINWGRGEPLSAYRSRKGWLLGDIIHSTPVVVGPPTGFAATESYQTFREANQNRQKIVYVGANDGMIHAFDAEYGTEEWAFVPEFALPTFEAMADSGYCHKYSCDQTVSVKDIKVDGVWRTILISGGREGGAEIYALDITDPRSPSVMWQSALPNGMSFHSEVEMVSVGGTPMAMVGSGLDNTTGEAWLYVFDLSTGRELGRVPRLSQDPSTRNKTTKPAFVDVNLDGEVDLVYVADLLGSVYRLETGGSDDPSRWRVTELYSGNQEITADPVAAFGPNGSIYLYFGTGAYLEDPDMTSVGQNSFICVFDLNDGTTVWKSDLANQTSTIHDMGRSRGWYVDLWNSEAERVTETSVVVAETVIFTSFAPSGAACQAGGNSWLYQMRYDDGGVPNVDGMEDPADRSVSVGEGVASYPVVDLTSGEVVVQSSDASITVMPIASTYLRMAVRSWQENYDQVVVPPPAQ